MAIDVDYMHICDYAFIGEAGKAGVIGIFETINTLTVPTSLTMHLAIKLIGNANEAFKIKIAVQKPSGENLTGDLGAEGAVNPDGTVVICVGLNGVQFPDFGRYTVKVSSEARTLVSQSLRVQKLTPPKPSPVPVLSH